MQKSSILVVEDEAPIREGLIDLLVFHGFTVESSNDGDDGLTKALTNNYDLVILDVMLPKRDGFSVCELLRKQKPEQLIIMLTAKTTEQDIITGLSSGADDYISKPFSVRELVLRVSAVLRRSKKAQLLSRTIQVGEDINIDTATLKGRSISGQEIVFTRREVDILLYLIANADRPVSRGELLDEVWGYARAEEIETRTVDIHIAKLRRKIEPDHKNPQYLITTRGEGYQIKSSTQG